VWTLAGFIYVSFVTDWGHLPLAGDYSRRILGWRESLSKTTPLVSSALEQALFTRPAAMPPSPPPAWSITRMRVRQDTSLASTGALLEAASPAPSARSATLWTTR